MVVVLRLLTKVSNTSREVVSDSKTTGEVSVNYVNYAKLDSKSTRSTFLFASKLADRRASKTARVSDSIMPLVLGFSRSRIQSRGDR
jgi:hypothetical protein